MTQQNGTVTLTTENNIGTIEFYHPKGNSLPGAILTKLADTIAEAGEMEDIRVLIIKSRGDGAFCAGASFDELIAIEDFNTGQEFFMGFAHVLNAMKACPKLIIVRVHGKTVGGGVGIAAAGDFTFATENAAIKLSELALGIGPFVIGPAVERKIGMSAFSTLSIDATNWHDATWAHEKGLFNNIFNATEEMDQAIQALAAQLSKSNPEAMRDLKAVIWKGTEDWDLLLRHRAEISGRLVLSDFTKNFIKKFKAK
jgi:methylglutaconyl-CoA hydratase